MFSLGTSPEGPKLDVTDLGKGPALSSFEDRPAEAPAVVRQQLERARELLPAEEHGSVPVSVLATAGMRLVDKAKADAVYEGLRAGLLDETYPFDRTAFHARTISGEEEASFAMVAANYLAGHLGTTVEMTSSHLMGVLDLGGSSTQIAVPPQLLQGASLAQNLGQAYVRSYLSFGMERMRQATYDEVMRRADPAARDNDAVPNPCAFYGYQEAGHGWRGTGDARGCEALIKGVLTEQTITCRRRGRASYCMPMELPRLAAKPASAGEPRFFLISAYMFVTDFVRWWLEHPNAVHAAGQGAGTSAELSMVERVTAASPELFARPTIAELRTAATLLCSATWGNLSEAVQLPGKGHQYTPAHKAPHRCFEMNYIVTVLSAGYGFKEDVRAFEVVGSIGGRDVEWTLGAFLMGPILEKGIEGLSLRQQGPDEASNRFLLAAPLVGIVIYAARRWWAYMNTSPGLHVS